MLCSFVATAQVTVAFQGGEGTAADNWNFNPITDAGGPMPPGITTTFPFSGTHAIRAAGGNNVGCSSGANCLVGGGATGCPSHGKSIDFVPLNVACLDNVQLSFYHSSHSFCSGNGFDSGEYLFFEVSLNGGAWTVAGRVGGFGDYTWTYATNPAGSPSSGYTVPNPFVYNVPAGTSTFAFRVRANTNRSDEVFYIDEVKLTTTTTGYAFPGTAGLWNGLINTDWNNACNWDDRNIPNTATDVSIPVGALNSCEILPASSGSCKNMFIDKQKLIVESNTASLTVTGNLVIGPNGGLDLTASSGIGGNVTVAGNWMNQRDESWVEEDGSTVTFNGAGNQDVTVALGTHEDFYKLNVNKTGGSLKLNTDIWVDRFNTGGAAAMLTLQNGLTDLNAHELRLFNPNAGALSRIGGSLISERTDNQSRFTREIGTSSGVFLFPFIRPGVAYIPLTLTPTSGNMGAVTAATYPTPATNLPWPATPVNVTNLISAIGLSPDNRDATVDRFWSIASTGTATTTISFTYAASELPIPPYNNPSTIQAQRYEPASNLWQPYLGGQSSAAYQVTAPGSPASGTWVLTNILSPLPVTLIFFDARVNSERQVDLFWQTSSELNSHYFTVEKSGDGKTFVPFLQVPAAGNSHQAINYSGKDASPFSGQSYYRLSQTDFDGTVTYFPIQPVHLDHPVSGFTVFPNPMTQTATVFLQDVTAETASLYLYDAQGRRITSGFSLTSSGSTVFLENHGVAAGVYYLVYESVRGRFSQPLVVAGE